MAEADEPHGEGAADVAGPDDSDVHDVCIHEIFAATNCRQKSLNDNDGGLLFSGWLPGSGVGSNARCCDAG